MNIVVQQQVSILTSRYEIETPACMYTAKKKFLLRHDRIKLLAPRDRLLATIRGHFFFRPKYQIRLSDGNVYRFSCKKFWKGVFVCASDKETFCLYQHKKLNYSIFQEDSQIASFSKNRVKFGGNDRYEIRANDNANHVVIICMALVIDCGEIEDETAGLVATDLGSLGPEDRPFDKSWQPN